MTGALAPFSYLVYKNDVTLYQLILCRGLRISLASAAQPGCSKFA